ncbi:uncharacterized protein PG986_010011 [Apiospora aurea]|uniref:Acyltransferase MbtK/IucB-like conserved domain-containing protein n=1 Tax=Apiospora aurea TaxID=335848 RepID=A0ABR1Q9D5_9PEZI
MSSLVHLPDGQVIVAQPIFNGIFFKSNDTHHRHTPFPAGWTIALHTEDGPDPVHGDNRGGGATETSAQGGNNQAQDQDDADQEPVHRFTRPTLQSDTIFISSISNPSSDEYEPAKSPSRQVALMLYISLYWYFQQPEPSPYLTTAASRSTPETAKPKGEWQIRIKRDGVFRTRNMIPKLERMGLISTLDTSVGVATSESEGGWDQMFVMRRGFWQIPSGLFLFTLQPKKTSSHHGSPPGSRPTSPEKNDSIDRWSITSASQLMSDVPGGTIPIALSNKPTTPIGPYFSASHLPTYYPPPTLQYRIRDGVRYPVRPKPPRMGEIFYTRFVPSVGKYLSFRVASASSQPVPHLGPETPGEKENAHLTTLSDAGLLERWLSNPRVSAFWGQYHENFLTDSLKSQNSFPVIGMWDGVPFGYFEIYWVKEDILGRHVSADDWDRGLHVLVGEEWARGLVPAWLSSLVHWCLQSDYRTMNICLEPRVDNERSVIPHEPLRYSTRFIRLLQNYGFAKERQVALPHKQSWFVRLSRDVWESPSL